jgi:hypothetical protein
MRAGPAPDLQAGTAAGTDRGPQAAHDPERVADPRVLRPEEVVLVPVRDGVAIVGGIVRHLRLWALDR